MATLASLRNSVTQKLGLAIADQALVDQWVNEGVVDVLKETYCHIVCADIATTAGQGDYTIDPKVLSIDEVTFNDPGNNGGFAQPVSTRTLLEYRTGTPSSDPVVRAYALAGADLLLLYPTPSAPGEFHIYYVPMPQPMTAPADDPATPVFGGVPHEYHKAIEFYALREGADFDDDKSSGMGQGYNQALQLEYQKIRRHLNRRLGRMPRARVGRTMPWPRSNDVYPVY